jgi:hypothetical protein
MKCGCGNEIEPIVGGHALRMELGIHANLGVGRGPNKCRQCRKSAVIIDAGAKPLEPGMARMLAAKVQTAVGRDRFESERFTAEMSPEMAAQWEMCGIPVQYISDDSVPIAQRTFAGFPVVERQKFPDSRVIIVDAKGLIEAELINIGTREVNDGR